MRPSLPLTVVLVLLSGCRAEEPVEKEAPQAVLITPAQSWRDSLVLRAPGGQELWLTSGREATGGDGETCVERTLQIRSPVDTIVVPLLYTGTPPVLLDDTTARADLWNDCVPGPTYLVNLRTGRPTVVP